MSTYTRTYITNDYSRREEINPMLHCGTGWGGWLVGARKENSTTKEEMCALLGAFSLFVHNNMYDGIRNLSTAPLYNLFMALAKRDHGQWQ